MWHYLSSAAAAAEEEGARAVASAFADSDAHSGEMYWSAEPADLEQRHLRMEDESIDWGIAVAGRKDSWREKPVVVQDDMAADNLCVVVKKRT